MRPINFIIFIVFLLVSCNKTSKNIESNVELRDIVMMTELKDEEEAIKKYEYYHSAKGVWPEVVNAAKVSGIKKIKIYRFANRLVMIITVPVDANMDEINRKYEESSKKIKKWSELMLEFQQPPDGTRDGAIWVPMVLIHDYENGRVR